MRVLYLVHSVYFVYRSVVDIFLTSIPESGFVFFDDWLRSLENQQKVKSAASRNEKVTQVYFLSYEYNFLIFFLTYSEVF